MSRLSSQFHVIGHDVLDLKALGLNEHFKDPSAGKKAPMQNNPVDRDALARHPVVSRMAENIGLAHEIAKREGLAEAGAAWYGKERELAYQHGVALNKAHDRLGLPRYHPEDPHIGGALLRGMYSQNNSELGRMRAVEQHATTGIPKGHLSTTPDLRARRNIPESEWENNPGTHSGGKIGYALSTNTHVMDMLTDTNQGEGLKLYDFTGSILHPGAWNGTWGGRQRGLGYTIDRHQHDTAMGTPFGDNERGLSQPRRYRVFQVAHAIAHHALDPAVSPDAFQAHVWGGWREGGYHEQS